MSPGTRLLTLRQQQILAEVGRRHPVPRHQTALALVATRIVHRRQEVREIRMARQDPAGPVTPTAPPHLVVLVTPAALPHLVVEAPHLAPRAPIRRVLAGQEVMAPAAMVPEETGVVAPVAQEEGGLQARHSAPPRFQVWHQHNSLHLRHNLPIPLRLYR